MASWLILAVSSSSPRAQAKRVLTVDDAIDLVQVSAPHISPDGRRVIYTISEKKTTDQ
ncbi:MAG TPA: hypothetical protein VKE96_33130 [Vicinamibacterales bacterium]|nr:hypothetical protein [Vicinamibacterales bacterium]